MLDTVVRPAPRRPALAAFVLVVLSIVLPTAGAAEAAGAGDGRAAIAGIWMPDPARSERPRELPFSKSGKAAVESFRVSYHPVEDDPGAFCLPAGMPQTAMGGADYPMEVIVTPSQVTLLYELHQQVRRVYLDKESPPASFLPQRNGHSIGRWQGDTLVVDTAHVKEVLFGRVPHSDQTRIQERLRTIDDGRTLINEITVTDPATYTRPIVIRQYYTAAPDDVHMLEYDCTEALWADHLEQR